jgi:hypothetical protein
MPETSSSKIDAICLGSISARRFNFEVVYLRPLIVKQNSYDSIEGKFCRIN